MNIKYHKWFSIELVHDYFPDSVCPVIDLIPSALSAGRMKNYEIRIRKGTGEFTFYVGMEASEEFDSASALNGLDELFFALMITDSVFGMYSEIPWFSDDQKFSFGNGLNGSDTTALQRAASVSKDDLLPFTGNPFALTVPEGDVTIKVSDLLGNVVFEAALQDNTHAQVPVQLPTGSEGLFQCFVNDALQQTIQILPEATPDNCLGMLRLDIAALTTAEQSEPYVLTVPVRSAFHQYKIIVPESRKIDVVQMTVTDNAGNSYTGPEEQDVIGGQKARVFTSPASEPLQQRQDKGPKLVVEYTNDMSTSVHPLEITLPNPSPESLGMYQQGEHAGAYFSSTIVYV